MSSELCPAGRGHKEAAGQSTKLVVRGACVHFKIVLTGTMPVCLWRTLSSQGDTRLGTDGHGVAFNLLVAIGISPDCWVLISTPGSLPALGLCFCCRGDLEALPLLAPRSQESLSCAWLGALNMDNPCGIYSVCCKPDYTPNTSAVGLARF